MASIVTDKLVCGNCVHIIPLDSHGHMKYYCGITTQRVLLHKPFCSNFEWTGITESPKQLIRFSQGEREIAAVQL